MDFWRGFIFVLVTALAVGIVSGLIGYSTDIHRVETLHWSWKALISRKEVVRIILISGTTTWLIITWFIFGLVFGLLNGLFLSIVFVFGLWIIAIIASGMVIGEITNRNVPNEGIKRSAKSALVSTLLFGSIFGIGGVLGNGVLGVHFIGPRFGLIGSVIYGLAGGLGLGILAGLWNGGRACLQHLALRLLLWCTGLFPWNIARFLDYCAERVFLRKVGGGYIFVHRLLVEHFASLEPGTEE